MKLDSNTRYLIVHADDGGLCRSVNRAIINSLNAGIVTSTSLMAPTPYFEEIANQLSQMPDVDVGVHVTLNCMYEKSPWKPVTPPEAVPSLVNADGFLRETAESFAAHATVDDVKTEIRAQIERFFELKLKPSHIDTHQGTVFLDLNFLKIYIELAHEFNLIPMLLKPNDFTKKLIQSRGLSLNIEDLKKVSKIDLPFLDFLFMADIHDKESFEDRSRTYHRIIQQLPAGLSQIIIHPGFDDNELKKRTRFSYNREYDLKVFTSDETRTLLKQENIRLINWGDLINK